MAASTAAKSKTTRKTTKKPAKPRETQATKSAKKQMWAVVLFALGILLGAFTFIEGDKLWRIIHNFLFGMFGISSYFLAPLLIYIAIVAALDKPLSSIKTKLWQVVILIMVIAGAFQIFGPGIPEAENFVETVIVIYEMGGEPHGGGLIGALIAWPLLSLFEKTGSSIIICLLMFVLVMLITGSTLIGIIRAAKKPVEGIEDAYAERVLEKRERESQKPQRPEKPQKAAVPDTPSAKAAGKFAFDVDISGDSDPETVPAEVEAQSSRNRLLSAAGQDSPVEYISTEGLTGQKAEPEPEEPDRYHPLDEDILQAEQVPEDDIGDIVERFMDGMELEPEPPALAVEPVTEPLYYPTETPPAPPPPQYAYPPASLLRIAKGPSNQDVGDELKNNAQTLVDTLKSFGVQTRITDICRGPAVTRYELQPSAGVKISKITGLADDIALNLASAGIRIEAPIPNKAAVGIEVPNKVVSMVSIREIIESSEFQSSKSSLTVALGKDIAGNITLADIGAMPHVLIAGATGSGKSVCINSIIMSLLYKYDPEEVKLLMVDPKVVELGVYNGIPHLLVPVVTDPKKAAGALGWAVSEMLQRYQTFAANSVRDLAGYNRLAETREDLAPMPKIVIIIDELADLMMAAPNEVEDSICRLAQMARAAGMHLVIATQRPSVDVITGVIKANIPSRIAFSVSSMVDSRTILDMGGAEKLLGRGDMLFYPVGISKPLRVQGCFVTESEVESVVSFIKNSEQVSYDSDITAAIDRLAATTKGTSKSSENAETDDEDEMLPLAIECVVEAGQASTSQLQRRLKLGYARAARIIDQLEQKGIVGPFEGSKPRQVMISKERWMEMKLQGAESAMLQSSETPKPAQEPPMDPKIFSKNPVQARPDEFEFANL